MLSLIDLLTRSSILYANNLCPNVTRDTWVHWLWQGSAYSRLYGQIGKNGVIHVLFHVYGPQKVQVVERRNVHTLLQIGELRFEPGDILFNNRT